MNKCYTWDYRIEISPYEKLMGVVEAFFASYAGGEYEVEQREPYRIQLRRGLWRKSWFGMGQLVPDRLVKGQFKQWPVRVVVLVRPSPTTFLISIRYELHLPSEVPALNSQVQSTVDQYAQTELRELAAYLAECTEAKEIPAVTTA